MAKDQLRNRFYKFNKIGFAAPHLLRANEGLFVW